MLLSRLLILLAPLVLIHCTPKPETTSGTVNYMLGVPIPHLDPIQSTNSYSNLINASIYEGLYHYRYFKRPLEIEPSLADGMPKVSADQRTYTIKIRPGVFFQDDPAFSNGKGRELVANDFIYSWKRLADPKNKASGWWVLNDVIAGLNQWRERGANYESEISGLKALDSHTLQIELTRPNHLFLHFLSMPVTMVVAHEVVDKYGDDFSNHPVGTGPYRLTEWTRKVRIVLQKNTNYRENFFPKDSSSPDAGKQLPLSDKVIVRIFTERNPQWLAFLKGEIDLGTIPKENYDQVFENGNLKAELKGKGISIHTLKRPDLVYIGFNTEHPILGKNKKLRQAMDAALNKKIILEKFYNGRGIVAHGPIPPGITGYNENYKSPSTFNLDKAKQLMKEAGFPQGKGLVAIDYELPYTVAWSRQFGELLKDQWSKIGIQVNLVANSWPQFKKKLKTKKAMMFDQAWMADYPDKQNFLQLFYGKNISPGENSFNFVNPEFDRLYEKMLQTPLADHKPLVEKMVSLLNEEVPSIFLAHRTFKTPYHSWLKNFETHPIIYDRLKYLRVDSNEKQEGLKKL